MNPARTFGPDLVRADFTDYLVYVAGPLVGAFAAVVGVAFVLRGRGGGPQRIGSGAGNHGYRDRTPRSAMSTVHIDAHQRKGYSP